MPISEVYNMDCMEYMKSIPDKFFDLAVVDPPYGINNGGQKDTQCKNNKHNRKFYNYKDWVLQTPTDVYFKELIRVSKNQIIFGAN